VYGALKAGRVYFSITVRSACAQHVAHTAWASDGAWVWKRDSSSTIYVFPTAKLVAVEQHHQKCGKLGFEVRDIESLREHYMMTLRA